MNWGEIKAAVPTYLENRQPAFLSNFPLYGRLAEEDIYRKVQLPMTRQTAQTNLIIGDKLLSIPSDFLSAHSLAIINDDGSYTFLLPKEQSFLNEAYADSTLDKPRFYAIRTQENFQIAPIPNLTYLIELTYFKKPVSITFNDNDTNTNWLSQNGENALIFGIIYHGYIFEKGDQDVVQLYKGQFDTAVADLKLIAEGRQKKDQYRAPDQRIPV